ncbi:response regulator [Aurantibacillus circumpalustris]|uniref:response regulator n=1 Tax=Aurantibacillus circumpalustris TaxID=3036359 RepID=UPI00295C1330|nr:response regulator [Aurantibacillus circumpalustris]
METNTKNLFIVDASVITANNLKNYLQNRFGTSFYITAFNDGETCLKEINSSTDFVIMDYALKGKNGLQILKEIKAINPKTEVIMLSANKDIAVAIESFRNGATDYVVKGKGSAKRIKDKIYHLLTAPIRILVKEFGVSKFMAAFLTTFVSMGIIVFVVMKAMY